MTVDGAEYRFPEHHHRPSPDLPPGVFAKVHYIPLHARLEEIRRARSSYDDLLTFPRAVGWSWYPLAIAGGTFSVIQPYFSSIEDSRTIETNCLEYLRPRAPLRGCF